MKLRGLQLFNQDIANNSTICHTRKVKPLIDMSMLKKELLDEGWSKNNMLMEKKRSLFSRFKNYRVNRGHKATQAMLLT